MICQDKHSWYRTPINANDPCFNHWSHHHKAVCHGAACVWDFYLFLVGNLNCFVVQIVFQICISCYILFLLSDFLYWLCQDTHWVLRKMTGLQNPQLQSQVNLLSVFFVFIFTFLDLYRYSNLNYLSKCCSQCKSATIAHKSNDLILKSSLTSFLFFHWWVHLPDVGDGCWRPCK